MILERCPYREAEKARADAAEAKDRKARPELWAAIDARMDARMKAVSDRMIEASVFGYTQGLISGY